MKINNYFDILWPPSLVIRQLASVLYYSYLIKWKKMPDWFFKHSFKSLPVAAGAIGMGCIGFPAHPAWEVTAACNLKCVHCHAEGSLPMKGELNTDEAKRFIDDLATVKEFKMLVYTGGEPLVRKDIFELLEHSKKAGLKNVIATNGILIDDEVAFKLKEVGVVGAAVSIDACREEVHNFIRQKKDALELAFKGIESLKKAGILLQINTTAMGYNFKELDDLIRLADNKGSGIMLMYQLVPVGRGKNIESNTFDLKENEVLLKKVYEGQKRISTIIEPVAGPQYWPYILEMSGHKGKFYKNIAKYLFHGCSAGRGFVYIKADGEVWPCPFVPMSAGNVKREGFKKIWRESDIFKSLRDRENTLKGECGECEYKTICGGCRGRALAFYGDYLEHDPSCFIKKETKQETMDFLKNLEQSKL